MTLQYLGATGFVAKVTKVTIRGLNAAAHEVFVHVVGEDSFQPLDKFHVVAGVAWCCDTFSQATREARRDLVAKLNTAKAFA